MLSHASAHKVGVQIARSNFVSTWLSAHERSVMVCSTSYARSCQVPRRTYRKRSLIPGQGQGRLKHSNCSGVVAEPYTFEDSMSAVSELLVEQGTESHRQYRAWNRGVKTSELTKLKISRSQKMRWKNPDLRASVSEKNKGRSPWNKGKTMSEETRRKMSEAKLNTKLSKIVRRKMRKAHPGLTHSQDTCSLLSEKLSGKSKSPEHRLKIASSQRKRMAALRVLKAVEAVHRQGQTEGSASTGTPKLPPRPAAVHGAVSSGGRGPMSRALLLDAYKGELREYRAVQEELSNWTNAFEKQHGRKPKLQDVEATGIAWLIGKYKQYVVLRERILSDTSNIRGFLGKPQQNDNASAHGETGHAVTAKHNGKPPPRPIAAAERLAAAKQYKMRQQKGSPDVVSPLMASVAQSDQQQPQVQAVSHGGSLAGAFSHEGEVSGNEAAELRPLRMPPTSAPPRVKNAIMAAMEYRRRKAAATSAQAKLAAVAAEAPPTSKRPSLDTPEVVEAKQAVEQAFEEVKQAELSVMHALKVMSLECQEQNREETRQGMQEMAAA